MKLEIIFDDEQEKQEFLEARKLPNEASLEDTQKRIIATLNRNNAFIRRSLRDREELKKGRRFIDPRTTEEQRANPLPTEESATPAAEATQPEVRQPEQPGRPAQLGESE